MGSNKPVAVITGAASGIGLELTKSCLARGMRVVLADSHIHNLCDRLEELTATFGDNVLGVVCDVSQAKSVEHLAKQTFQHYNRVDWLINNAGICGPMAPIWELSTDVIRQVMDVNLYGAINGVHAFLPLMLQQSHRSHIINMASFYGLCSGSQLGAYAMSKHAVLAFSESLYFDLQRLNHPVDVSVICPSFTNTGLLKNPETKPNKTLHSMINELIARSRAADEVAELIMHGIDRGIFYILPDKEVKNYCEQRTQAILEEKVPAYHSLEKILASLAKKAAKKDLACVDG